MRINLDGRRNANPGSLALSSGFRTSARDIPGSSLEGYRAMPDAHADYLARMLARALQSGKPIPRPETRYELVSIPAREVFAPSRSWTWRNRPPATMMVDPAVVVETLIVSGSSPSLEEVWWRVSWADEWRTVTVPASRALVRSWRRKNRRPARETFPAPAGSRRPSDAELDAIDRAAADAEVEAWRRFRESEREEQRTPRTPRTFLPSTGNARLTIG